MQIVCDKLAQEAQMDARKFQIKSLAELQKLRENVIRITNRNLELERVERAKITGQALIEKAKAEKEAKEIKEKSQLALRIEKMQKVIELLRK